MNRTRRFLTRCTVTICAVAFTSFTSTAPAAEANETLAAYEKVSQALLADNLADAQKAAVDLAAKAEAKSELAKHATALSKSSSLDAARDHFKGVSREAIALAEGKEGYHVMTCPMVEDGEWLQTSEEVANPYMGQKMVRCGRKKKTST